MKGRTRFHLAASRVHKWLALMIGAQLLIWFASGVIMSFLSIDKVRGEHLVDREVVATIPPDTPMAAPATLIAQAGAPVEAVAWRFYDFFWSLHITDWKNHENFDTWWFLAFVICSLALGIASTVMLFMRWPFCRKYIER